MTETRRRGEAQAFSLAGEGIPKWLMFGFALIGLLTAVAAAWVYLAKPTLLPEQQPSKIAASSSPPDSVAPATRPVEPVPASAEPASPRTSADQQPATPMQPAVAPVVPDAGRLEAPAEQAALAKTPSLAMLVDCPEVVTIMFDFNSARPLGAELDRRVEPLRAWLAVHREDKLLVEGHADTSGSEQGNLILSYLRAKALFDLLRKSAVPQEQLVVRAAGSFQPVAGHPGSAAANRRVVLQIGGSENCRPSSTGSEPR